MSEGQEILAALFRPLNFSIHQFHKREPFVGTYIVGEGTYSGGYFHFNTNNGINPSCPSLKSFKNWFRQ